MSFATTPSRKALILLAVAGLATAATNADVTTYRWWNPTGAPVTGNMADSPNWQGFVLPSTADGAMNHLSFDFASPTAFSAFNNLKSGLSVAKLTHGPGSNDCAIQGATFHLIEYPGPFGFTKPVIDSQSSGIMTIYASFQGTDGLEITGGTIAMTPVLRSTHTLTGGIDITGGELIITDAWHLGALSNSVTVDIAGTLRPRDGMSIAVPIDVAGGAIDTDTTETVTIQKLKVNDRIVKYGPGTLHIERDTPSTSLDWWLFEGTLLTSPNAANVSYATVEPGATLRCGANMNAAILYSDGLVDLDGYQLTIEEGYVTDLAGSGTLKTSSAQVGIRGNMEAFSGELRPNGNNLSVYDLATNMESTTLNLNDGGIDIIGEKEVAAIIGTEALDLFSDSFTFGLDNADGAFEGTIRSIGSPNTRLIKDGSGWYSMTGEIDVKGPIEVRGGTLAVNAQSVDTNSPVQIGAGATFACTGSLPVSVPPLSGSGTFYISGSSRAVLGEVGGGYTFSGSLSGGDLATLRKRGESEIVLTGNSSQFVGFLEIYEGAIRYTGQNILPSAYSVLVTSTGALRGYGHLGIPLLSYATVASDVSGQTFRITGPNHLSAGAIEATGGGILELDGAEIDQGFAGPSYDAVIRADGGTVRCTGTTPTHITSGRIETNATGEFQISNTATTLEDLDINGNVTIDPAASVTMNAVNLQTDATHTLTVHFDPAAPLAPIRGHGTATLGGTLDVSLPADYTPTLGDRVPVFAADGGTWTVDADFDSHIMPDASPHAIRVDHHPDGMDLVVTHLIDFDLPYGTINAADVAAFLDAYNNGDLLADIAAPKGQLDIADIHAFFQAFRDIHTPKRLDVR